MSGTIFLTVSALIYTIITTVLFYKKDIINKLENRIYKKLLLTSIVSMFVELLIVATVDFGWIGVIVQKSFLVCIVVWLSIFMLYTFAITTLTVQETEDNFIKKFRLSHILFVVINIIIFLLIYILPIEFVSISDNIRYTRGPSVNVVYVVLVIYVIAMIILILKSIRNIHKKGFVPIIALIVLMIISGMIQKTHPELLLTNAVFGFIIYLMYHTIENPDLKMIEQLEHNRKIIEQSNTDKSNFLFRMTQEVKRPIDDILKANQMIKSSDDIKIIKQYSEYIDYNSKELKSLVNGVFDISKMDTHNIKIQKGRYNIYNTLNELFARYSKRVNENVDFRYNISNNIPKILYGDSVKLKQVVNTILDNSIKYTKKGFIDINVDSIIKNNVCRLIISIEDSGIGMSIDKINKLLTISENLSEEELKKIEHMNLNINVATKILRMLGGQLIIKSEENIGSEFIIILEQIINNDNDSNESKYENIFNKKRVLLVSDNQKDLNILYDYLEKNKLEVVSTMYANECIDKINNNEKYDLIIVEDEMKPITGINLLQQLKHINKFKVPVVILLDKDKESIKEHYLGDGFSDYILKTNITNELERIIKKFI